MRKLVLILGSAALAVLVAAPVAQTAPSGDKIAGSGVWTSPDTNGVPGPDFGVPTVNVNASDKQPAGDKNNNKFTFAYKNPAGETIYLVQGPITSFAVQGNSNTGDASACLIGTVAKEQGTDPRDAQVGGDAGRFDVGEWVPIAIAKFGDVWKFNFNVGQTGTPPTVTSVASCPITVTNDSNTPTFDSADFSIFDA